MTAIAPREPQVRQRRGSRILVVATVSAVLLFFVSIFVGASSASLMDVIRDEGVARVIFFDSRLPRTIAVVLAGSSIAVAGAIMQALTQNRFVAPSTAGTTESAILGITVITVASPGSSVGVKMVVATLFALAGTLLFVSLIQRLRSRDIIVVPLIGMMLGAVVQSIAWFIAIRNNILQSLYAWIIGDFSGTISGRYELLYVVGAVALVAYFFADRFTLAGVGRDFSVNVGLNYDRTVVGGMVLVSLVAGITVVVVGTVPFWGLIVPNLVSLVVGDNQRRMLPVVAAVGAAGLLAGDILARTIRYPTEIPVGTVVGVVGGCIFLAMLVRSRS
ncbi:MAG: iron chelate uptake ABC transporter family permease subunit [Actinomycetota bacterium]